MGHHLTTVDGTLAHIPGVVSVWCGDADGPVYTRAADVWHPAASTMKVAVLAALYRAVDDGRIDLDQTVTVHNAYPSAHLGASTYGCNRRHDSDDEVWQRLGSPVRLGWLAERMITVSSNLATNLVIEAVGLATVRDLAAPYIRVGRGIEDSAAADAGIANEVTAAGLAGLFLAIQAEPGRSGPAMLDLLAAQRFRDDLAAGLPAGTRVAYKNGWLSGIRHAAGVVFPADAPPFTLAVCLSTPLAVNRPGDAACQIVARIAAAAWADRHER